MLGASILWPMGYGYDEPQHVDMAYVYADFSFTFYDPGELRPTEAGRAILRDIIAVGWPPERPLARAPIADRGERPSSAELGGNGQAEGNPPNQMIQHPPLGYWVYAVALDIPGVDALAWDLQVWGAAPGQHLPDVARADPLLGHRRDGCCAPNACPHVPATSWRSSRP